MEKNRIDALGDTGDMGDMEKIPEINNGTEDNNKSADEIDGGAGKTNNRADEIDGGSDESDNRVEKLSDNGAGETNNRVEKLSDDGAEKGNTAAEREEYDKLIKTRFKDFYTEDTQRMINRRFKQFKALEERCRSLEESLASSSPAHISDDELIERIKAAEDEMIAKYSDFSLDEVTSSSRFMALARLATESRAISLLEAYDLAFFDKIVENARREAEMRAYDKVRANRMRGIENAVLPRVSARGISASQLTKSERSALARRAANGERIGF